MEVSETVMQMSVLRGIRTKSKRDYILWTCSRACWLAKYTALAHSIHTARQCFFHQQSNADPSHVQTITHQKKPAMSAIVTKVAM